MNKVRGHYREEQVCLPRDRRMLSRWRDVMDGALELTERCSNLGAAKCQLRDLGELLRSLKLGSTAIKEAIICWSR